MGLSVLIADDNELNRWLLAEQLQAFEVEIVQVINGAEAWELLRHGAFELAFIDLNMPLLSGVELLEKLRAATDLPHLRCVAVTAHAGDGMRQRLLRQGFDDCLIKPISMADLQRIVQPLLGIRNSPGIDSYAASLLRKVETNRGLAALLLDKMFEQVPAQFSALQQQLQSRCFPQAWAIAHQLHGTFCFVGFEDFRALAQTLEQSLKEVADDGEDARWLLQALRDEFERLVENRESLRELLKG